MIWRETDIAHNLEKLVCTGHNCQTSIDNEVLILTRQGLVDRPPDILFTTTEMLNQRMSDTRIRKLFGIGQPVGQRPIYALLDEVHTYIGTSGAQAALVLRRWSNLVNSPIHWCGLSATLLEAARFFSDLTGLEADKVEEIKPETDEMIEEGAEYQVILKGDPTLQTSVLSTSIQSAMLLSRMLDPGVNARSEKTFGRKLFVFTDDLDVTNRLFDNLRDAEAYTIFGAPDPARRNLASLRNSQITDLVDAENDGQRWRACETIGRDLSNRLLVGRTASQDPGVLANADVIIATAALEVGYNDNQVGAVLQHKSPRNFASFLQRKGRSGRDRKMRPFTVTVLSDFGRDRIAFQAYENLFDPTLPPQHLPVLNQYVLRMQAVFSLFDWMLDGFNGGASNGWIWDVLSRPSRGQKSPLLEHVKALIGELIKGNPDKLLSLHDHLCASLGITKEICNSILWEPPRSIMLEVIPTLARRLFVNWELAFPVGNAALDLQVDYHPLPDFVPRNLFSDLSLPEVLVHTPPATVNSTEKTDAMPILQALQQVIPGRVTRRFAFERGGLSHWVNINPDQIDQSMPISAYAERNEPLGLFSGTRQGSEDLSIEVYRPWNIRLTKVPINISPTSNATPLWYSGFIPNGEPLTIDVPARSGWFKHVSGIQFYLHQFRSNVTVRRFSPGVRAIVRKKDSETLVRVHYVNAEGSPAAIGYEVDVDGFFVDFNPLELVKLTSSALPDELIAGTKLAYHRSRFLTDTEIPIEINTLQREWLHQMLIAASVVRAQRDNISLGVAASAVLTENPRQTFSELINIFLSSATRTQDDDDDDNDEFAAAGNGPVTNNGGGVNTRLGALLTAAIGDAAVIERLLVMAPELDIPNPEIYAKWLRNTIYETLSEGILQACISCAPRHAAIDTLLADLVIDEQTGAARVWITESTLGGAGVIQAFAAEFASNPLTLFRAVEAALSPSDLEISSLGLKLFLELVKNDEVVSNSIAELRKPLDHQLRNKKRQQLYCNLGLRGLDVNHALSVSINTRFLKPGSGPKWDLLIFDLIDAWEKIEMQYKFAIGLREFSFIAMKISTIRARLLELISTYAPFSIDDPGMLQIISGLIWPRGIEVRQRALQSYNPFSANKITDSSLVRALLLSPNIEPISISDDFWQQDFSAKIAEHGVVQLVARNGMERNLKVAIIELLGRPVDVGYLQFFPTVDRIERGQLETRAFLSLREQV